MKKTVLIFGLISGAISSAMMFATLPFLKSGTINFDNGEIIGYATIILSFLLVFFGIRSFRENKLGGTITRVASSTGRGAKKQLPISLLCLFTTVSFGADKLKVADAYGKLPLSFEANQGQSDAQVKFLSHGSGYTLFLTSSEAVLLLQKGAPSGGVKQRGRARIEEPVSSQYLNRGNDGR